MNFAANIQRKFHMGKSFAISEYCCQVPANGRILHHRQHHVPRYTPALEPHPGIFPHYLRRLSGIHEIVQYVAMA